ncbi:hypothetical protein D3C72_922280 [compost metagenome]
MLLPELVFADGARGRNDNVRVACDSCGEGGKDQIAKQETRITGEYNDQQIICTELLKLNIRVILGIIKDFAQQGLGQSVTRQIHINGLHSRPE